MKEIHYHKHCPLCKSELIQRKDNMVFCSQCNREIYLSPRPCVSAIIIEEGRILFSQRAREPFKDGWDFPGGFIDYGESAEEALKRELEEELDVELISARYLGSDSGTYVWQGVETVVMPMFYECKIKGLPKPKDDVAKVEWHAPEDYKMLCFKTDHKMIKKYYLKS